MTQGQMPRNTGLVQAAEQLRQQHRQAPPKYSEGSMPQPHRMRERAPPYQPPIQSEGSMSSARAAAAASSASSSAAPSRVVGLIDESRRRQGLRAVRDPYTGAGKPKGKALIHVPAPVMEYFDVKNDHFMMKQN